MALSRRALLLAAAAVPAAAAIPASAVGSTLGQVVDPLSVPPFPTPPAPVAAGPVSRIGIDSDYAAVPSVAVLPTGELVMAYTQGPDHFGYGATTIHTSSSADHGASWAPSTDTGIHGRDVCLSTDSTGRLWMSYFTASAAAPATGVWVRSSADGGHTWSTPARVDPLDYAACSAPVVEHDGVLWLPWYGRARPGGVLDPQNSTYLSRSVDGGQTWTSTRVFDGAVDGRSYAEPWLTTTPDGLLLTHRYGTWNQVGAAQSVDGVSWPATALPAFSGTGRSATVALPDGTMVCVYRSTGLRDAVFAASLDGGFSWPWRHELLLASPGSQFGMLYAHPVLTAAGTLYCPVAMEETTTRCALWHTTLTSEA